MDEIIKIKCPNCGAVLAVKMQSGIENKKVTCPVCNESALFKDYKKVTPKINSDDTQYPGSSEESTDYKEDTELGGIKSNNITGHLKAISGTTGVFQVNLGRNVIGRKASSSKANIKIPVSSEKNRLSREHIVIDVKNVPGKGLVHYLSLYKERLNDTFLNKVKIEYGDCLVLNHGDVLELPDVRLRFEIPDEDMTEY